jgi:hypothetical protein
MNYGGKINSYRKQLTKHVKINYTFQESIFPVSKVEPNIQVAFCKIMVAHLDFGKSAVIPNMHVILLQKHLKPLYFDCNCSLQFRSMPSIIDPTFLW